MKVSSKGAQEVQICSREMPALWPVSLWVRNTCRAWMARRALFEGCFAAQALGRNVFLMPASSRTVANRTHPRSTPRARCGAAASIHAGAPFRRGCRWGIELVRVRGTLTKECF